MRTKKRSRLVLFVVLFAGSIGPMVVATPGKGGGKTIFKRGTLSLPSFKEGKAMRIMMRTGQATFI